MNEDTDLPVTPSQRAAMIHRIRTLMEFWCITPEDLERAPEAKLNEEPEAPEVKYRHPVSGETWDGVGSHPEWLRHALLKQGYTVQQLREAADRGDENSPDSIATP